MTENMVSIRKMGLPGKGYRVFASWRLPKYAIKKGKVDLWIPELAPRLTLAHELRKGAVTWHAFKRMYALELRSSGKQNLLKPLALLSFRRNLVLLCGCPDGAPCPNVVLAKAILECRKAGNFRISFEKAA